MRDIHASDTISFYILGLIFLASTISKLLGFADARDAIAAIYNISNFASVSFLTLVILIEFAISYALMFRRGGYAFLKCVLLLSGIFFMYHAVLFVFFPGQACVCMTISNSTLQHVPGMLLSLGMLLICFHLLQSGNPRRSYAKSIERSV